MPDESFDEHERIKSFEVFKEKGYLDYFNKQGIQINPLTNFVFRTPLAKNPNVFGFKKKHLELLKTKKEIVIVAMKNRKCLKEYLFFVFDINNPHDVQFFSGSKGEFQYVYYCIRNSFLRIPEEYKKEDIQKTL